jgi:4-oxalomesaconate hydratase
MQKNESRKPALMVLTAHVGDFVWRSGGAIALHAEEGHRVVVLCLAVGEYGESAKLWAEPGMSVEIARARRIEEAQAAAHILGAELHILHGEDYPLRVDQLMLEKAVALLREVQPAAILTHAEHDPTNPDHVIAHQFTLTARQTAQAHGRPGGPIIGAPQVYCFEPHQSELCRFNPDTLLDITSVWDRKWQAMQAMQGQTSLWSYYENVAEQRGNALKRRALGSSGKAYGEAYSRVFPSAVFSLV